jgi:parvulin-like peptidyl-prolyl isomerase
MIGRRLAWVCASVLAVSCCAGAAFAAAPKTPSSKPAPIAPAPVPADPEKMVLDRVVASVNDEAITLSEVQEEGQPVIRKIFQDFVGPERDRRVEEAQNRLMQDLIERRLMYQVAKKDGMLPSTAEVQGAVDELKKNNNVSDDAQFRTLLKSEGLTLEQIRRSIGERLAIGRLLARQIRAAIIVSEEELQKYYGEHTGDFSRQPEAEIFHVHFPVDPQEGRGPAKERAEKTLAALRGGADFPQTAKEALGRPAEETFETLTVHKGDLAPQIEAAAFGTKPGEVSPLVETESGWHIIKVLRVRADTVAPYAEIRDTIRDRLFQEKFEAKRKEWLSDLRNRSSIQVFIKEGEIAGAQAAQEGGAQPHP